MADNNTESMKDFEKELESSFKVIKEGDILNVTVIGISETEPVSYTHLTLPTKLEV